MLQLKASDGALYGSATGVYRLLPDAPGPHDYEDAAFDADGMGLYRHFCPTCGSAVMITLDRYPGIRSMMGGTLDDKTRLKPSFSLWCASAQPWLQLPASIELFAEYPDGLIA